VGSLNDKQLSKLFAYLQKQLFQHSDLDELQSHHSRLGGMHMPLLVDSAEEL
jgi:hypothetical protein